MYKGLKGIAKFNADWIGPVLFLPDEDPDRIAMKREVESVFENGLICRTHD